MISVLLFGFMCFTTQITERQGTRMYYGFIIRPRLLHHGITTRQRCAHEQLIHSGFVFRTGSTLTSSIPGFDNL